MKRYIATLLPLALMVGACDEGPTAPQVTEQSPAFTVSAGAASFVWNGQTYEYGCPNSPCPVPSIFVSEVGSGHWQWVQMDRVINLYRLKIALQVRKVTTGVVFQPDNPAFLAFARTTWGPSRDLLFCTVRGRTEYPWSIASTTFDVAYPNGVHQSVAPLVTQFASTGYMIRPSVPGSGYTVNVSAWLTDGTRQVRATASVTCKG